MRLLLLVAASPAIWVGQFLLAYITAAVWCARFPGAPFAVVQVAIALYTAVALAGMLLVGAGGYRRHRHDTEHPPHDADTLDDRNRFLGFATLLLSGLSALAAIYVGLTLIIFEGCAPGSG